MSALADIRADSGWNENFTIQTGNGEKTVYVNANIVVPDFDNMSVVEVENVKIDADYEKAFSGFILLVGTSTIITIRIIILLTN